MSTSGLVIVSNRLPISLSRDDEGGWRVASGAGGLVSALAPVLRQRGGQWIGWLGTSLVSDEDKEDVKNILDEQAQENGYRMVPVELDDEEVDLYYRGFSNEVLWPLFHDFTSLCDYDPRFWETYSEVNERFARRIIDTTSPEDVIWVHDYHMFLVALKVRQMKAKRKMLFFLHIPFPSVDIFIKCPWRKELLQGLLSFDMVGFQTKRDQKNFEQCVRSLFKEVRAQGTGVNRGLSVGKNTVFSGAFPISIDADTFEGTAVLEDTEEIMHSIQENFSETKLMLGVDRLDYSKGIPQRMRAFALTLDLYPELRGNLSLLQIVVPSRRQLKHYEFLKKDIERLVGEINGRFGDISWTPIQYIFRSFSQEELIAYYRASDIALITPLKDGMNLVAKEYCMCHPEGDAVLILSEFAGAATELGRDALLVNPFDETGIAEAIYQAYTMPRKERARRMRRLKQRVKRHTIFDWVKAFLDAGEQTLTA